MRGHAEASAMFDLRVCVAMPRRAADVRLRWPRCAATMFAGIAVLESSIASAAAVQSCLDDGGPTTLRSVVANAASNDTITLPDCKISLISGAIEIPQAKLTLY